MSRSLKDLPRDLRILCSGYGEASESEYLAFLDPIRAYAVAFDVKREIEQMLNDSGTTPQERRRLKNLLKFVEDTEIRDLEERLASHYRARKPEDGSPLPYPKVDIGAKLKMEKLMEHIRNGTYSAQRQSKALQAVRKAWEFQKEHGRMPSHAELKKLGFNNQQVTDAGKWLAEDPDNVSDGFPFIRPLHKPKRGRPKGGQAKNIP